MCVSKWSKTVENSGGCLDLISAVVSSCPSLRALNNLWHVCFPIPYPHSLDNPFPTIIQKSAFLASPVSLEEKSPTFLVSGSSFMEDSFSTDWGCKGWFQDDSNALHLSCSLFLLLLRQLHLRSSDVRSSRLGTPALKSLLSHNSQNLQDNSRCWH